MEKFITIIIILIFTNHSFTQNVIEGTIINSDGYELVGASILFKKDGVFLTGTNTNKIGDFSIMVDQADSAYISYVGFKDKSLSFDDILFDGLIILEKQNYLLEGVVVTANGRLIERGFLCIYSQKITTEKRNLKKKIEKPLIEFSIYPNPTAAIVNIESKNHNLEGELQLINQMGIILKQTKYTHQGKLNLADLPSGLYYLKFKHNDNIAFVGKILKTE